LLLLGPAAEAQGKSTTTGLPPLIDREIIFGNPEIAAAQISPNGQYIAFLKPWKDTRNLYVKAVNEPFSAARLLTTETKRPIPGYFWTHDSKSILYVKDKTVTRISMSTLSILPPNLPQAAKPRPRATSPDLKACASSSTKSPSPIPTSSTSA